MYEMVSRKSGIQIRLFFYESFPLTTKRVLIMMDLARQYCRTPPYLWAILYLGHKIFSVALCLHFRHIRYTSALKLFCCELTDYNATWKCKISCNSQFKALLAVFSFDCWVCNYLVLSWLVIQLFGMSAWFCALQVEASDGDSDSIASCSIDGDRPTRRREKKASDSVSSQKVQILYLCR